MRRPGGIRVVEEREIYALREQLNHYPLPCGPSLTLRAGCIVPSQPFRRGMSKRGSDSN